MKTSVIKTRLRPHIDQQLRAFATRQGISRYAAAARLIERALQPEPAADRAATGALLELAALHESLRPVLLRSLEIAAHGYVYAKAAARAGFPGDRKKLDEQVAAEAADLIRRYTTPAASKE